MKKSHKKQLLNISFVIILAVLTIWLVYSSNQEFNLAILRDFISKCNPWLMLTAVAFLFLYIAFEGVALHRILRRFGYRPKVLSSWIYSTADIYYSAITPSATGGQPASAFYMIRDGIPAGTTCFALVFNLVGFSASFILLGVVILLCNLSVFFSYSLAVKLLILLGIGIQIAFFCLFLACMFQHKLILKIGNFFINLLCRIRIFKNKEKWQGKLNGAVEMYRSSLQNFKEHKGLLTEVILYNLLQRICLILISCCVCVAATDCSFVQVFVIQTFVVLGYNAVPLPGGSLAFEYIYLNAYESVFEKEFILASMMVTRAISYYGAMILGGMCTMIYHVVGTGHSPHNTSVAENDVAAVTNEE